MSDERPAPNGGMPWWPMYRSKAHWIAGPRFMLGWAEVERKRHTWWGKLLDLEFF